MKIRKRIGTAVSERGFTLLELIIAVTLLATIILVIAGAVRLGYRSMASGEKKMDGLERFRSSLTVIDNQIQSAIPLSFDDNGSPKRYFEGTRSTLTFATNYSIWGGMRGYVVVQYRVLMDQMGKQTIYASEALVGSAVKRETMLLTGLDQIYFEYLSRDITQEGQWVDQWADEKKLPELIRIHLVSGFRDICLIIPMRAEGPAQARLDTETTGTDLALRGLPMRLEYPWLHTKLRSFWPSRRRRGTDAGVLLRTSRRATRRQRRGRMKATWYHLRRDIGSDKGIALLMVLWVMTILMVIALSFSFMTRTETHATLFYKEGTEKKFLAEAGFNRALMEIFNRAFYKAQQTAPEGIEMLRLTGQVFGPVGE